MTVAHLVIRSIRLAHCKRGPERCAQCREMDSERICLLDVDPADRGLVQRRVLELEVDGRREWREFDVLRVFADAAEARAFAAAEGIEDVRLDHLA
jgi:hypothetical protein